MAEMVLGSNGVRASTGTKFFMDGSSALEIQAGAPIGLSAVGKARALPNPLARGADKPEQSRVRLAIGGQTRLFYLPLTVTARLGYFNDEGLEMSWQTLMMSGSVLVASFRADQTREALALRIIDTAATGERDVTRLRDDAVAYV